MRNITTRFSIHEMYEQVRDDRTIMSLDAAIESVKEEMGFILTTFRPDDTESELATMRAKLAELESARAQRVETMFRGRLNRLDKDQLISLVMTGEFPVDIPSREEAGIPPRNEPKPVGMFMDTVDAALDSVARCMRKYADNKVPRPRKQTTESPQRRRTKPAERRTEPTVSDSPDTSAVESPAPAVHPAEPAQACVQRKKPKFRRKPSENMGF